MACIASTIAWCWGNFTYSPLECAQFITPPDPIVGWDCEQFPDGTQCQSMCYNCHDWCENTADPPTPINGNPQLFVPGDPFLPAYCLCYEQAPVTDPYTWPPDHTLLATTQAETVDATNAQTLPPPVTAAPTTGAPIPTHSDASTIDQVTATLGPIVIVTLVVFGR